MAATIHATALVAPDAELGDGVEVGAYTVIGPGVEIGAGTRIGAARRDRGPDARSARDNQVFQFASIGDAPQDKKYKGEPTRLEIGDRNVFREFCTINRGTTKDEGVTRIGRRQPVHGLFARGARLRRRQPLRAREHRDARRPRASSATG